MKYRLLSATDPKNFHSDANLITYLRLIISLPFFILAITKQNPHYNFIGLVIHWLGDLTDGFIARKFNQETIFGAEIDIIADRVEILFFFATFLFFQPKMSIPVIIYVIDYAFIDFYLSYQFLKYDIISPNYFYKVNRTVYILNYSPGGKFCNSTVIILLMIFLPQLRILAGLGAMILVGVKIYSIYLLNKKTGHGNILFKV